MDQNIDFSGSHAQPKDSNKLFQKLLEDLKELAEYVNSPSRDHPIFFNDNEDHFVQYKEYLENSSNEIVALNSNQKKEKPPQDFEIQLYFMHDNVDDLIESALNSKLLSVAPILSTKEPDYSLSMRYEHPNTTPKMESESDETIKSGVKELVPILSENEVTSEDKRECDVPVCEYSPICDDHSEIFSDSKNNDDISSDDDDFEDIEYVEASLPDPEIVSVDEKNVVYHEEEEVDLEDVFEIQDVVLHEKLLSINRLISNIESLNDNPTPNCVRNSSTSIPIFEESDNSLSDNFSPEFKTFYDHTEETRSGSTITHVDNSLPEYDSFCFEIEPDQERLINAVKNDISDDSSNDPLLEEVDLFLASDNSIPSGIKNFAYDSEGDIRFLEALLIDDSIPFLVNELSNFEDDPSFPRPPPEPPDDEFDSKPEVISAVMKNIDELNKDKCFDPGGKIDVSTNNEDDDYFPFIFVIRIFLPYLIYTEVSPLFLSDESEDTISDPDFVESPTENFFSIYFSLRTNEFRDRVELATRIYPSLIKVPYVRKFVVVRKSFTSFL
nr:hypothetical protein [Tanacetum cinerariifolium]